jgi:Methyltransferase domain
MSHQTHIDYIGDELTVCALANRWKRYFCSTIARYTYGKVAEVGAGLGSTTQAICNSCTSESWLCIEPDEKNADRLEELRTQGDLPQYCKIHCGILADLPIKPQFDTILYIDVLEHIEDDYRELTCATSHLTKGGHIIVLSPAWPHLYSSFDRKTGHHRRYTKRSLNAIRIAGLRTDTIFYLDSVGYLASLANKLILNQPLPTESQIMFWDRTMIPFSRVLDPIIGWQFGRSVVAVWQKVS